MVGNPLATLVATAFARLLDPKSGAGPTSARQHLALMSEPRRAALDDALALFSAR
jgi:hypothetical protein